MKVSLQTVYSLGMGLNRLWSTTSTLFSCSCSRGDSM